MNNVNLNVGDKLELHCYKHNGKINTVSSKMMVLDIGEDFLVCGDYKSDGAFCNGKKMGTINITGNINSVDGPYYNPLLSYSGTSWLNASSVYVHCSLEGEDISVTKYNI